MTQAAQTLISSSALKPLSSDASGHTQASRSLAQLANDYFSTQERSLADWLNYIDGFSQHLAFFDVQTLSQSGSWQAAMPSLEQVTELEKMLAGQTVPAYIHDLAKRPDIALLLAFFQMMTSSAGQFNQFTHDHKQFYYRQVLGFSEKPEVADQAHLIVKLAAHKPSKTLQKGTLFKGGEDQDGRVLLYQSVNHASLNHSQVVRLATLSRSSRSNALLLTEGYNEEQGLDYGEAGLLTFGEASILNAERQHTPQQGFTLASQALYLSAGRRVIKINFQLKDANALADDFNLGQYFEVGISTAQGLMILASNGDDCQLECHVHGCCEECGGDGCECQGTGVSECRQQGSLEVSIILDEYYPAICNIDDQTQAYLPSLPHLSFVLKEEAKQNSAQFSALYFSQINLHVSVTGLGGVVASHDIGSIDTSKPFEPFTHGPKIGSKFHFTHPELLTKNIGDASLNCRWLDRPENMDSHYESYRAYYDSRKVSLPEGSEGGSSSNNEILAENWPRNKAKVFYSHSANTLQAANIFSEKTPLNNIDQQQFHFITADQPQAPLYHYQQLPLDTNLATQWPRWFSLELSNHDFGHSDYSLVSQYIAQKNIKEKTDTLVNPPYTPVLSQLSINYQSQVTLDLDSLHANPFHALTHIQAMGRTDVSAEHSTNIALLPRINKWGYLYIGVAEVPTPGQFRLYFQLDPVDGGNTSDKSLLSWSYLHGNEWKAFSRSKGGQLASRARIIEDSTYNLLDSGVVTFELPDMDLSNNFIKGDVFWIRVALDDMEKDPNEDIIAKYSRLKSVHAQGVQVALIDQQYHASHYAQPLAADSITALHKPDADIAEILMPFASFAGKEQEASAALEIRASERIRHKNRALTPWDFEHLVLAKFPELFMVRCFRNPQLDRVEVVVVPVNHDPSILQPKVPLYLKRRIQRFLVTISSPGIEVLVIDPEYEEVTFNVTLNILEGYDIDSAVAQLNQMLIDHMTPWNKQAMGRKDAVSRTIYLAEVASVLEGHPAVEIIYSLRANMSKQPVRASSNGSILVPVADHEITLLNQITEIFEGVGLWRIGNDFRVA
ncbi:MAG: hypothetical protein RPT11_11310 [Bermanella sp.]